MSVVIAVCAVPTVHMVLSTMTLCRSTCKGTTSSLGDRQRPYLHLRQWGGLEQVQRLRMQRLLLQQLPLSVHLHRKTPTVQGLLLQRLAVSCFQLHPLPRLLRRDFLLLRVTLHARPQGAASTS